MRNKSQTNRNFLTTFSWCLLHVFALSSDWLITLFKSVFTGWSNYFVLGFTTLNWKPLQQPLTLRLNWPISDQEHKYHQLTFHNLLDSDDDFHSVCPNVSQCHQQQFFFKVRLMQNKRKITSLITYITTFVFHNPAPKVTQNKYR